MHKVQSRIASIELNAHAFWEILFKPHAVVTLEDIVCIYRYVQSNILITPILMDWRTIQGIEFEAMEHIARSQTPEHPLVIVSEAGSIGEKYGHLIEQLGEQTCSCFVFTTMTEARSWLTDHYMKKEA